MRLISRLIPFVVAAVVLVAPLRAHAQTISLVGVPNQVFRFLPDGTQIDKRPQVNFPEAVNLDDCRRDIRIRVPIATTGFEDASLSLQAWGAASGTDCKDIQMRQGATRRCYQVLPGEIPRVAFTNVDLRARDIIAATQATTADYVNATEDICGKVNQSTFVVTFMWLRNNANDVVSSVEYQVPANTIGPAPLSGVAVVPGDTRLKVTWTPFGSSEAGTTSAQNVTIYYAPATPGAGSTAPTTTTEVCPDASTTADPDAAITDAGSTEDATCTSVTTPGTGSTAACTATGFSDDGQPPSSSVPNVTTGVSTSQGLIEGLENGVTYAVVVAATDPYLNPGQVGEPICASPELLDDFFEVYRKAGGQAGGGLCTLTRAEWPGEASAALFCGTLGAVGFVTRRRRRARASKGALS